MQTSGEVYIAHRRFRDTGRVVMRENDGGRIVGKNLLDHFTWIDVGAVDRAKKELLEPYKPMPCIQKQAPEDLALESRILGHHEQLRVPRAMEHRTLGQARASVFGHDWHHRFKTGNFGGPEIGARQQRRGRRIEHCLERAELLQQAPGHHNRVPRPTAGSDQHCQQLRLSHMLTVTAQQALSRPFQRAPIGDFQVCEPLLHRTPMGFYDAAKDAAKMPPNPHWRLARRRRIVALCQSYPARTLCLVSQVGSQPSRLRCLCDSCAMAERTCRSS